MTRASVSPVTIDPQVHNNFTALKETINGGLDVANFKIQIVTGETSSTPDTQELFPHSVANPQSWLPLVGDVYVQEINGKNVDVRSTKTNVAFKILLISGTLISPTQVQNPDSYLDTIGVIQSTAATGNGVINANYYYGYAAMKQIQQIIVIGDYVYWTHVDSGATSSDEMVHRMHMTTGVYSSVDPGGSQPLAAMYYSSTDGFLYVSEDSTATTVNVYKIDLDTFTVDSTVACVAGVSHTMEDIAVCYVDADGNIYLGGLARPATSSANYSKLIKFDSSGTLVSTVSNATGTGSSLGGYKCLVATDDYFYVTSSDGALATEDMIISKIAISGFTLTSTITVADTEGVRGHSAVLVDDIVYIPCGATNSAVDTVASGNITYANFLAVLNTSTDLVTKVPFTPFQNSFIVSNTTLAGSSVMSYDSQILWCSGNNSYTDLYVYDIVQGTISAGAVVFGHDLGKVATGINNILVPDSAGIPTIFKNQPGTGATISNTAWCQPII